MVVKLAENLYGEIEKIPTRDGYGEGLLELGKTNPNVVVLCADLRDSTRSHWFAKKYPDRFMEMGIAEQDMISVAAGLSTTGKIPFASTFAVFASGRALDQVRMSVAYPNLNVKIGASHSGLLTGENGASHQATEDIALMRVLPNMKVIVPCDVIEAKKATLAAAKVKGPVYLRFGREKIPVITTQDTPFEIGRAEIFREGRDVSIIACGSMVYEALRAAKELENEISVRVINCHTVKPIDEKTIIQAAKETGAVVTAEEHQLHAGFGGAVAEVITQYEPVPMRLVGIKDKFGESGSPEELMKEFGLTHKEIIKAVHEVLRAKRR